MCGIAVLLGNAKEEVLETHLRGMLELIHHRGPDSIGTITGLNIGLGHRRLSIVDLSSAGHQPMQWQNRYWITYNGEIYNYPELREELKASGYEFQSMTDTEVILAAYDAWGEKCLDRFNGMFAFGIWDLARQSFFAARDRFGVKPLYYWQSPTGLLAFASEIKQLTCLPGWKAQLNGQLAYEYLNWSLTDHTPDTFFAGVHQIPPGHSVEISLLADDTFSISHLKKNLRQWYVLKPALASKSSLTEKFLNLLTDSVRLRLRSDVAVGSCLSGGLDSTSIVALINELLKNKNLEQKQRTFSAVFPGETMDESKLIAETVDLLGIENIKTTPTQEKFSEAFEKLIWHQDEPIASTSIFAQWDVFRIARESGVTVMLDGQGSDEQLAGYHIFFGPHLIGVLKQNGFIAFLNELNAIHRLHGYSRPLLLLKMLNHLLPNRLRTIGRRLTGRIPSEPDWIDSRSIHFRPRDPWRMQNRKLHSTSDLSWALLTSLNLQMLLRYEDRNSMAHSIEARVPFLDYRLVELSLSLPDQFKIRRGLTKWILRESLAGRIPESIRTNTRKIGFETPENRWFSEPSPALKADLEQALSSATSYLRDPALSEFKNYLAGTAPFSARLFRIYCFEKWRTVFAVAN